MLKAIELLDDAPQPSALLRGYRGMTFRPAGDWEAYYTAIWAETVKALSDACEVPTWTVKRALGIPSGVHFREFW